MGANIVVLQETHCLSSSTCLSWFPSSGFSAVVSLGPPIHVVVLSFFIPRCIWLTIGVMSRVVIFRIFPSLVSPFVYGVYAPNRNPGSPMEAFEHLLFFCPLARSVLSWLQSLMFSFSFMCPSLLSHHVLFGFNSDKLVATPISLCIC